MVCCTTGTAGRAGCTSGFFCSGSAGRRYRESSRTGGVSTAGSCSRTGCLPRAGSGRTGAGSSGMSAIVCCTGCGRRLRPLSISSGISAVSCRQWVWGSPISAPVAVRRAGLPAGLRAAVPASARVDPSLRPSYSSFLFRPKIRLAKDFSWEAGFAWFFLPKILLWCPVAAETA